MTANWKPVILPDNWSKSQGKRGGNGWYHFRVKLEEKPTKSWALLVENVSMNASVFVGQHFLGDGGSFADPVSRNWVRPLLFKIPQMYLNAGDNDLFIRVYSSPIDIGGLEFVHFGLHSELIPTYESLFTYYILSSQAIFYMQVILSLLLIVLWYYRRQERDFLWLSAASLMGAIFPLNMFVRDIPISHHAWEWAVQVSIGWFVWFTFLFAHRYLYIQRLWLERIIAYYALIGAVILMFLPASNLMFAGTLWQGGFALVALYIFIVSVGHWWKTKSLAHLAWVFAVVALFLTGIIDWMSILLRQLYGITNHLMFHLGTSALVFVASALLLSRFLQALKHLEHVNQELEGKVDSFQAEAEQRQAVFDERQRIMRDLHDGLGNSLVSAMALSKGSKSNNPELQGVLQDAMAEMRLIVGSADNLEFDFEKALTLIKERTKLILHTSNITFDWQIEAILTIPQLNDSELGMHVVRILQEALSNAIKHANASQIRVMATSNNGILKLCVSDNGQGIVDNNHGHGLNNMKSRADSIHATLSIHSDTTGTTITLSLPIV